MLLRAAIQVFAVALALDAVWAGSPAAPNYWSCINRTAAAPLAFCNTSLPILQRAQALVGAIGSDRVMERMNSARTSPIPDLGVGGTMYNGPEAVHGVSSVCMQATSGEWRCPTILPSPPALGASFNSTSWREGFAVVSTEQRVLVNAGGTRVCCGRPQIGMSARGPVLNLAAHPRWGRNHNGPSEDRYLTGVFGTAGVRGFQEGHVGEDLGTRPGDGKPYVKIMSELKHFAAYEVEANRFAFVDNATWSDMFDTYLPAFEATIRDAGPLGYMCSYPAATLNTSQPVPMCASTAMSGLARQWGFGGGSFDGPAGYIESDCGALENIATQHHYVATTEEAAQVALRDGHVDLNCGNIYSSGSAPLGKALAAGMVTEAEINASGVRSTSALMMTGAFDGLGGDQPLLKYNVDEHFGTQQSLDLSLDLARQGMLLLRNPGGSVLPVPSLGTVAAVGPLANSTDLSGDYFGNQCHGGGNGCVPTVVAELTRRVSSGGKVEYVEGCDSLGCDSLPTLKQALAAAEASDLTVIAVGDTISTDHEGHDRSSVALTGQQASLVSQVAAAAKTCVVLVITGETVGLDGVPAKCAIVAALYPGPRTAEAVVDALVGADATGKQLADLFGRSPFTWMPSNYTTLQPPGVFHVAPSSGSLGLTYRWYAGPVVFPFGAGETFSNFTITPARLVKRTATAAAGWEPQQQNPEGRRTQRGPSPIVVRAGRWEADTPVADAEVTVKNTGSRAAAAVVTIYSTTEDLALWEAEPRPQRTLGDVTRGLARAAMSNHMHRSCDQGTTPAPQPALVGFTRVVVGAGDSVKVTVPVSGRSMRLARCNMAPPQDSGPELLEGLYALHVTGGAPPEWTAIGEGDESTLLGHVRAQATR